MINTFVASMYLIWYGFYILLYEYIGLGYFAKGEKLKRLESILQ